MTQNVREYFSKFEENMLSDFLAMRLRRRGLSL